MNAVERGNITIVKAEIDKGTNPNDLPSCEDEPIAPLCAAAADGNLDIIRVLLNHGADINRGDGWDFTPLEAAAINNRLDAMELLFVRGATINDFGDGGSYSLWRAAVEGKVEAVNWLLAHGANPNTASSGDMLLSVVKSFHLKVIARKLEKAGAK